MFEKSWLLAVLAGAITLSTLGRGMPKPRPKPRPHPRMPRRKSTGPVSATR